jgi:hypothetical protein
MDLAVEYQRNKATRLLGFRFVVLPGHETTMTRLCANLHRTPFSLDLASWRYQLRGRSDCFQEGFCHSSRTTANVGCASTVTASKSTVCRPTRPEFMPMERVWNHPQADNAQRALRYPRPARRQADRDLQYIFQRRHKVIAAHVARFR